MPKSEIDVFHTTQLQMTLKWIYCFLSWPLCQLRISNGLEYGITILGIQFIKKLLPKNQRTQRKYWILSFGFIGLSKIGHHFSNKVIKKLILSKHVNNKKCAPKLVFFNEKKNKRLDNFLRRKLTLKVKFWHVWRY